MAPGLDISIIGPGKVGTAVGVLAVRSGLRVVAVAGGGADRARAAAEQIGGGAQACSPAEAATAGRLVLLTVPDDAIAAVCERLAAAKAFTAGTVVAHCSGALPSGVLSAARDCCGCHVGSMHPLQTFPTVAAALERLAGAYCFCEGDEPAVEVLERLAGRIGATAARIDPAGKVLYHAAAVMACNYMVSVLDAAAALAESAGLERSTWLAASAPMLRAGLANVTAMGPEEALTGPIARGDVATVDRHVAALAGCGSGLRRLYAAAGHRAVEIARRGGRICEAKANEVITSLNHLLEQE